MLLMRGDYEGALSEAGCNQDWIAETGLASIRNFRSISDASIR